MTADGELCKAEFHPGFGPVLLVYPDGPIWPHPENSNHLPQFHSTISTSRQSDRTILVRAMDARLSDLDALALPTTREEINQTNPATA